MTTAASLRRLRDLGFDEADARTRLALLESVVRRHAGAAGRPPAWSWFVPGRVEILGTHTDYAGGRSLLAAVPRGFAVAASPRDDAVVRLCSTGTDAAGVISSTRPARSTGEHSGRSGVDGLAYVAAVARRLALNFPGAALGVDLTIASDLPRAAGLSSSSALVVGAALALIRRAELDARPEWLAAIRTPYDLAGYLGAVERGAPFASLLGTHAVGVFGGSEDHTAILTCRAGFVSAFRYVPIQPLGEAPMPDAWRFVIATSGVEADKAGAARVPYNRASLAAEALVELWNRHAGTAHATLAGVLSHAPEAARQLDEVAGSSDVFPPELLRRRLAHFIAEDGRVPPAMQAFAAADRRAVGDLARASQRDAETLLQNQTDATSALARLAVDHGAFAASSFGAGFGGSVWALAAADEAEAFSGRWLEGYRARYPALGQAGVFVARPGPGVMRWL